LATFRGDGPAAAKAKAQAARLQDGLDTILRALSGELLGPDEVELTGCVRS
jgi:hypothetical protein